MLKSTRLKKEEKAIQDKMNGPRYLEIRSDDPDAETRTAERAALAVELSDKRDEIIDAMDEEQRDVQLALAPGLDATRFTAEQREYRTLAQRTSFENYVLAALGERHLDDGSAEAEYNQHVFGGEQTQGTIPIEMFLDRDEQIALTPQDVEEMRTVITGVAGTHGMLTFIDRIFETSDGVYLGATMPAVGPGRHSYPVVSGSGIASTYSRDSAETPAGGLTVANADPQAIQMSYEIERTDELQMPGIGAAVLRDARMAVQSGFDNLIVDTLLTELVDGDLATVVETLSAFLGRFGGAVDGIGAKDVRDVRILVSAISASNRPSVYGLVSGLNISNIGHFMNLVPHDRVRATRHIAAPDATDKRQAGVAYRTGKPGARRLICPVWRRAEMLRDTGRLQLKRQTTLTVVMYADVIVANSDLHQQLNFKTAA